MKQSTAQMFKSTFPKVETVVEGNDLVIKSTTTKMKIGRVTTYGVETRELNVFLSANNMRLKEVRTNFDVVITNR